MEKETARLQSEISVREKQSNHLSMSTTCKIEFIVLSVLLFQLNKWRQHKNTPCADAIHVGDLKGQIDKLTSSKKEIESVLMQEREVLQASKRLKIGNTTDTTWKLRINSLKKELDQARSERDMYKNLVRPSK